jgi:twitching motility two-component system response regulator PilH
MSIKSILIVDDSKTEQIHLGEMLRGKGYVCFTADNVDEARKVLSLSRPDLILMDVVMPGQSGFQLTRELSKSTEYASIPIVMCTSKDQEVDKIWGLRQGAKAYLTKPISEEDLLAAIESVKPS